LSGADLSETSLRRGYFAKAKLENTRFIGADLTRADFNGARLAGADLSRAYLEGANLIGADLSRAALVNCDLRLAVAVDANLSDADLTGSRVYGISAWNVCLEGTTQRDLVITPPSENAVTTDNVQVAIPVPAAQQSSGARCDRNSRQKSCFDPREIYRTAQVGPGGDTARIATSWINTDPFRLRRTTQPRHHRNCRYLHLARAIIADLTDARSVPQELMSVIPNLPSVPLKPIIAFPAAEYGMFEHFRKYPWVREAVSYVDSHDLLAQLRENIKDLAAG
jgi:pentapeptide repeat protein